MSERRLPARDDDRTSLGLVPVIVEDMHDCEDGWRLRAAPLLRMQAPSGESGRSGDGSRGLADGSIDVAGKGPARGKEEGVIKRDGVGLKHRAGRVKGTRG